MFLTLLGGLAQLHTLNVTPEFVRRAIKKLSKRFELSKDGYKVRWTGGCDGTRFAADDEKTIEHAAIAPQDFTEDTGTGSSSKRSKTNSTSNVAATLDTPSEGKTSGLQTISDSKQQQLTVSGTSNIQASSNFFNPLVTRSAFDYKPIVLREKQLQHEDLQGSDGSFDTLSGDSGGLVNALNKSNLNQKAKDEGVVTFYHNPHFCSDFSSETEPSNMRPARPAVTGETLGMPAADILESPLRYHDATYFTTQFAPKPFDLGKLSDEQRVKFDASLPKLPNLPTISEAGESETMPLEFDVCGLGRITPDDNFALDIKVSMKPAPTRGPGMIVKRLPFSNRRYLQKFTAKVESCEKLDLLPSKLPPPSYVFFTSSSSSDAADLDDDSDDDSDCGSSPFVGEVCPAPPAFSQQFSGDPGEDHGDDEDNDMDSEIDMLAIARQVNPEQIAEQERVYMLHQPGGAQRGVAGSLAATVGETSSASSMHRADAATSTPTEDGSREEYDDDDDDDEMDDA